MKRTRRKGALLVALLALILQTRPVSAAPPTSPEPIVSAPANAAALFDAGARSGGNDRIDARLIGDHLFAVVQPAQVLKVRVDRVRAHRICGLLISGVKFHDPLNRYTFRDEIVRLTALAFAAAPIEEVDITTTVPTTTGRGAVVSGDFAMPTSRTVFTATTLRAETPRLFGARIDAARDIYWNPWFIAELRKPHALLR